MKLSAWKAEPPGRVAIQSPNKRDNVTVTSHSGEGTSGHAEKLT